MSKTKNRVFHDAVFTKSKRKIAKRLKQNTVRENQLLREYRTLRNANAFIDHRSSATLSFKKPVISKRTRAEKFNLDDLGASITDQTLGLSTTPSDVVQSSKKTPNKVERLVKFKQARAEHVEQVEEDKALLAELDGVFKQHKTMLYAQK